MRLTLFCVAMAAMAIWPGSPARAAAPETVSMSIDPQAMAEQVKIYRDEWGVAHIDGANDAAAVFGMGYAQAEDYFWQVEDTYILGLGRYAEIYGKQGLNSDLLNRAFEIVPRSQEDFKKLDPELQEIFVAYTAGLNYYLQKHPEVKPRMITHFEPWMVMAYARQVLLEMAFRYSHVSGDFAPRSVGEIESQVGSNAWAVSGDKTASGNAMLFINPHQPWFGFGQFYEAHMRSREGGWNFTGGTFFGAPLPGLGHNEHCGWAFTVNEPDVADAWIETFDHPEDPLKYRYDDGYRTATRWVDTVNILGGKGLETVEYTFTKTHHGPIVRKHGENQHLAVMIGKYYDGLMMRQMMKLVRAEGLEDFQEGMSGLNFQFMNTVYADQDGNIYYLYNGIIPKRDPSFDWSKPVDGSNPKTEWQGYHPLNELPQVLNPASGFVQSCNSTPFTTTNVGNPFMKDFPDYMVEEKHDDKRRAKVCRMLLEDMEDVTFDQMVDAAYDTTLYWPLVMLPRYQRDFQRLVQENPRVARQVKPYLDHLLDWDCRGDMDSTQTTLCVQWYEEMYGFGYPAETLKQEYKMDPDKHYVALIQAAAKLKSIHGDWKVAWGDINRIQRYTEVFDLVSIPFDDSKESLPCAGIPGPLGVVFTQYYTPSINIPFVRNTKKRYGVVGLTYMSVIEFGEKVRSKSVLQFGVNSNPESPNYIDQSRLLSERKMKETYFHWDEVEAAAKVVYHPGEEPRPHVASGS